MRTMILHCVRHGESVYNAEGRLQGHLEVPLSARGLRQAEATAEALAAHPIEAIYASPLCRARQTAEVIARRLRLPVRFDDRLKEIDVGRFQGRLRTELHRDQAKVLARWASGDPDFPLPGGESRRQVAQRGQAAFEAIRRAGHPCALVVAHGTVLLSTIKVLAGLPLEGPPRSLQNASITTVRWPEHGPLEILAIDQVAHLDGLGPAGTGDLVA